MAFITLNRLSGQCVGLVCLQTLLYRQLVLPVAWPFGGLCGEIRRITDTPQLTCLFLRSIQHFAATKIFPVLFILVGFMFEENPLTVIFVGFQEEAETNACF